MRNSSYNSVKHCCECAFALSLYVANLLVIIFLSCYFDLFYNNKLSLLGRPHDQPTEMAKSEQNLTSSNDNKPALQRLAFCTILIYQFLSPGLYRHGFSCPVLFFLFLSCNVSSKYIVHHTVLGL